MSCTKKTYNKVMARVRSQYPNYSLKRRKQIANGIIYGKKKGTQKKKVK